MAQLTYYVAPWDRETVQDDVAEYIDDAAPKPMEVKHGYTLADLEQMTRAALTADRSLASDIRDRRDAAWSAIAEHLCAAEQPPTRQELIRVGWQAIYREIRDGYQQYGYADRAWDAGHASAPRFLAYWYSPVQPSHEERIVERMAVGQVLAPLGGVYRDAVIALAAADDYRAAAGLLGIKYEALVARIGKARKKMLQLWHEGETPRKVRRTDRRVGAYGAEPATHCGNGHEWTLENTRVYTRISKGKSSTRRFCRACERARTDRSSTNGAREGVNPKDAASNSEWVESTSLDSSSTEASDA